MNNEKLLKILNDHKRIIHNFKVDAFKTWQLESTVEDFTEGYKNHCYFSAKLNEVTQLITYIECNPCMRYSRLKLFLANRILDVKSETFWYKLAYEYNARIFEIESLQDIITEAEKCES